VIRLGSWRSEIKVRKTSSMIPDTHVDLLNGPVIVALGTLMPDGQPQITVVWCNYDGTHVKVNTVRGRQKEKNMSERPMATVLAVDPDNPYRYLEVRGKVEEITEQGAIDHINELARLYAGESTFYGPLVSADRKEKETRVICRIRPTHVTTLG
jgi:PPOX class probable F420-dependent enzyme